MSRGPCGTPRMIGGRGVRLLVHFTRSQRSPHVSGTVQNCMDDDHVWNALKDDQVRFQEIEAELLTVGEIEPAMAQDRNARQLFLGAEQLVLYRQGEVDTRFARQVAQDVFCVLRGVRRALRPPSRSALVEEGLELLAGHAFSALDLREAFVETPVKSLLVHRQPKVLIFQERQGVRDDLGGSGVMAALDFALDDLFAGGIEGQVHKKSISLTGQHSILAILLIC